MATGCFASPPSVDDDASSSSGESSSDTSDGSTLTTTSDVDSSSGSSTGIDATSSDEATSSTSVSSDDDSGSSTGEAPCGCVGDEVLCESFEPPFDPDAGPWVVPKGGADPTIVEDPVHCGANALRTAVQTTEPFSATNYAIGMEVVGPGPHHLRTWIRMEASCTDAPTRILNLQLWGGATVWYSWALYTAPGGLDLIMRNHNTPEHELADADFGTGEWHELELVFDVTSSPPVGSVILDGNVVIDALAGQPLAAMVAWNPIHSLQLGIYRDDALFPNGCTVYYDDVRVTTP
jgi:hypothetical protein